ncbi:hypothetical protein H9P43_003663 [Blastocladiella emersonii ATCC 22665]|nr:hypothetical protein H9P43_003663 [Blastocladiella emersonii ATCC 22665]
MHGAGHLRMRTSSWHGGSVPPPLKSAPLILPARSMFRDVRTLRWLCAVQFFVILVWMVLPALRGPAGDEIAPPASLPSGTASRIIGRTGDAVADTGLAAAEAMSRFGSLPPPRSPLFGQDPSLASNDTAGPVVEHDAAAKVPLSEMPDAVQKHLGQHAGLIGGYLAELPPSLVLGKMFQGILKPSDLRPYLLRASSPVAHDDITIATMITPERIPRLQALAATYPGPVSVTLYLDSTDRATTGSVLTSLLELRAADRNIAERVDLHLVVDPHPRQLNYWRNVARVFARSELVMQVDVDFALCTDLRAHVRGNPALLEPVLAGRKVYVVPAFEYVFDHNAEMNETRIVPASEFPTTKPDLVRAVRRGELAMFHASWWPGHGPTLYPSWLNISVATDADRAAAVYPVPDDKYSVHYEPYVVMRRDLAAWCDERFVGYGANKAACLYEVYLSGVEFAVLPDDWLIHQDHDYPATTRANERKFNHHLYNAYRAEQCVRYKRMRAAAAGQAALSDASLDTMDRECRDLVAQRRTHG